MLTHTDGQVFVSQFDNVGFTWQPISQDFTAADLLLASLGDPGEPLAPADEARLGAPYLSLERLATLHAAARTGVAHAKAH